MNQNVLDSLIRVELTKILQLISDEYDINYSELEFLSQTKNTTCLYKFTRGKNKGNNCGSKALDNNYCKTHQSQAIKLNSVLHQQPQTVKVETKTPKTRQEILEWLNTAVPQETTKLFKHDLGLIHKETDIIFNDEFMAIGKVEKNKLTDLENFEIEYCEKMGWKYLY